MVGENMRGYIQKNKGNRRGKEDKQGKFHFALGKVSFWNKRRENYIIS